MRNRVREIRSHGSVGGPGCKSRVHPESHSQPNYFSQKAGQNCRFFYLSRILERTSRLWGRGLNRHRKLPAFYEAGVFMPGFFVANAPCLFGDRLVLNFVQPQTLRDKGQDMGNTEKGQDR